MSEADRALAGRTLAWMAKMEACDYRVATKPDAPPSKHARKHAKYAASELGRARTARYESGAAGHERRERYNWARYMRRLNERIASGPARLAELAAAGGVL